jgi:hypothetical protein
MTLAVSGRSGAYNTSIRLTLRKLGNPVSGASTPGFWLDLLAGVQARESDSSGALLRLARGGPGPGKKFVEAIVGPEVNQPGEDIGEPSLGIDAGRFGCFDE